MPQVPSPAVEHVRPTSYRRAMGREDRVLSMVTYDHGCWLFLGRTEQGYGRIGHHDGTGLAHRAVYIALIGRRRAACAQEQ